MTSSRNTAWIAGTGVLAVLIVVASYFLLISPKRAEAAETVTTAAGVEQSNDSLAAETERLKAQFATLDEQRSQLAEIQGELPDGSEIPALIRQFSAYATGAGVTVTDIAPGVMTEYVSTPSAGAAALTEPAADGTGTATAPVPGSGISSVSISVTVDGTFAGTELFVKNLQADMHRYFLVDSVTMAREDTGLSTTITGSIFVLQNSGAAATGTSTTDTTATTDTTVAPAVASTSTGTVN